MPIDNVLTQISRRLYEHFRTYDPSPEPCVVLTNPAEHDGNVPADVQNKILMTLVGLQSEATISTYSRAVPTETGQHALVSPPLYIDMLVMIMANSTGRNYREGLKRICQTIAFSKRTLISRTRPCRIWTPMLPISPWYCSLWNSARQAICFDCWA
ncbi:hypothetical protein [Azospirillum sp.]|uniref:hypothetical protein n=1 Tax=Azospirillum sp. TaxID=34012 RepID=UPI002D2F441D|nr:hypothetical protein [Azospirillum sp.]HYF89716.1 hypothetical protein [Azospirillum sp.]